MNPKVKELVDYLEKSLTHRANINGRGMGQQIIIPIIGCLLDWEKAADELLTKGYKVKLEQTNSTGHAWVFHFYSYPSSLFGDNDPLPSYEELVVLIRAMNNVVEGSINHLTPEQRAMVIKVLTK